VVPALANPVTGAFDLLLAPFGGHAAAALAVVSLLCGVATILIFKATSNQAAIRRARDRITAHILEMRIYQDDLVLILDALGATLASNLRYLRVIALPLVVIGVLVAIVFTQLDARFARAPIRVGDATLVTVTCPPGVDVMNTPASLEAGEGAAVDAARVRVPARREVTWHVRAERTGTPALTVRVADTAYSFTLNTEGGTAAKGSVRSRSPWSGVLHPGLPPLPGSGAIQRIEVRYPPARPPLLGWRTHWLVVFLAWSLVGALIPKVLLRIEV